MKIPPAAGQLGTVRYTSHTGRGTPPAGTVVKVIGPAISEGHVRVRVTATGEEYELLHAEIDCGEVMMLGGQWRYLNDPLVIAWLQVWDRRKEFTPKTPHPQAWGDSGAVPKRSSSRDYAFHAFRRGVGLIIKGMVPAPPGSEPFLIRAFSARPNVRVFRLGYKQNSAEIPFTPHDVEHYEPDVSPQVDTLQIQLPDEEVLIIERDKS